MRAYTSRNKQPLSSVSGSPRVRANVPPSRSKRDLPPSPPCYSHTQSAEKNSRQLALFLVTFGFFFLKKCVKGAPWAGRGGSCTPTRGGVFVTPKQRTGTFNPTLVTPKQRTGTFNPTHSSASSSAITHALFVDLTAVHPHHFSGVHNTPGCR
jgi:hypothetical protein